MENNLVCSGSQPLRGWVCVGCERLEDGLNASGSPDVIQRTRYVKLVPIWSKNRKTGAGSGSQRFHLVQLLEFSEQRGFSEANRKQ